MRRCLEILLLAAVGLLLASCGGGETVAEGGIGGTGVSMGRVSQIGSVYVNGIHYNTDNTVFVINGNENNQGLADIGVGMVVRVAGSKDNTSGTGVAERVEYDSLLVGPVDVIFDSPMNHIGIMGQAVHINDDTVVEDNINDPPLSVDQIPTGVIIEVSGYPSTPGEILATRIELKSATGVYRVSGTVSAVDTASNSFSIGDLRIDASAISPLPDEGSVVLVESPLPPSYGNFTAASIAPLQTGSLAADGEELTLEGVITTRLDPVTHLFEVNGQSVDASYTAYATDEMALAAGRVVHVDGVMNGSVLLAEEITLEPTNTRREEISAVLLDGAVDLAARTVTLLDKTVHITNETIFENDRHGASTFVLDELQSGDYLQAKVIDHNGELTATKLELDYTPSSYDGALEGYPSNLGGRHIEILGVEIDMSGISGYHFSTERTSLRGIYDSDTRILTATRVEEEDD